MKTVGIIAEYNPFHNGHLYQLEEARRRAGADFAVIAMSGDFVQRGEPAIYDKYTRTAMALNCGADLVLELPVSFATGSAEDFAACGVALLDRLGAVDALCFGSEYGGLAPLKAAAEVLCEEPEDFASDLKMRLKAGESYPAARSAALCRYLDEKGIEGNPPRQGRPAAPYSCASILASPNNILGIEYLKALIRLHSPMEPITIQRAGRSYHDASVPGAPLDFPSATALRGLISGHPGSPTVDFLHGLIPPGAALALEKEQAHLTPIFPDDLSRLLEYRLLGLLRQEAALSQFADLSPELADRLTRQALHFESFTGRVKNLKTRQYTYTRVSRALLHLLLGITGEEMQRYRENGYALYARILGFRRSAAPLLAKLKKTSGIPLVTKTADASGYLGRLPLSMLEEDMYASHLYQSLVFGKGRRMKNEYTRSVIILP